MTDPRQLTVYASGHAFPGQIAALEGGRGQMRVRLDRGDQPPDAAQAWPPIGSECQLEMHDGARFWVVVTGQLEGGARDQAEFRMKLIDRTGWAAQE